MSVHLSPILNGAQFFGANGRPLSLGLVYTYAAGTSTPQATYADSGGISQNVNPLQLDASGRVQGEVWLTDAQAYKFVLKDSGGSTIWSLDNISTQGDGTAITAGILAELAATSPTGASLIGYKSNLASAVATTVQAKLQDWVDVKADYGALGNGIADDTAAIQAALSSGGNVYFPPGDYLVSSGLRPVAGQTLMGSGYNSRILCPSAGWLLVATTNYGIINVNNVNHVRVTGLRVYGTTVSDQTHTPKLVYFETVTGLMIDHCWFENTQYEGIWNGGTQANNREIIIEANQFDVVGQPAGAFVGLPAIQLNCEEAVVVGNRLFNVGVGIGASGARIQITGNLIRTVTVAGITAGDNGADAGVIDITGNTVEMSSHASVTRVGILLSGGLTNHAINVTGNLVRLIAQAGDALERCYRQDTAPFVNFAGNVAEIEVKGIGFEIFGTSGGSSVCLAGNVVRVNSEGANCTGFGGVPNAVGNTLTVRSSGNKVFGVTRANGSYAYDYNANGGGTLDADMAGDFTAQGNVRCGTNYGSGEWDNTPIFENSAGSNITLGARSFKLQATSFANVGTPANGSILWVSDGTAGNPLTGAGTGCFAFRQGGVWIGLTLP